MTLKELFETDYYFIIGAVLAAIYLILHIYTNRNDNDIVLDFICIAFCFILVLGWPIIIMMLSVGIPVFGTLFLLGWILNKIRTR